MALSVRALPFLIDLAAFAALYYLVPKAPVHFSSAMFGAVLSSILFGLLKWGFAVYILRFSSYGRVYGAVATIPVFLFWLYLAWTIVLFGAECCYQAQYLPRKGRLWKRSIMAMGDGRLLLGLQALSLICSAYKHGRRLPDDLRIAEVLGCSTVLMKPILDSLERAGIVSRGGSRSAPLSLLLTPEKIRLSEVVQRPVSLRRSGTLPPPDGAGLCLL
jgi:membrane protein